VGRSGRCHYEQVSQCCFCGQVIKGEGALTLVAAATVRVDEETAPKQQLWTHAACLGERLDPSVPFDLHAFDE
jgi:hypothetical protein